MTYPIARRIRMKKGSYIKCNGWWCSDLKCYRQMFFFYIFSKSFVDLEIIEVNILLLLLTKRPTLIFNKHLFNSSNLSLRLIMILFYFILLLLYLIIKYENKKRERNHLIGIEKKIKRESEKAKNNMILFWKTSVIR